MAPSFFGRVALSAERAFRVIGAAAFGRESMFPEDAARVVRAVLAEHENPDVLNPG